MKLKAVYTTEKLGSDQSKKWYGPDNFSHLHDDILARVGKKVDQVRKLVFTLHFFMDRTNF